MSLLLASGHGQAGFSPWQLVPPSVLAKPGAQRQKKDPWLLRHSPRGAQYSSPTHSSTSARRRQAVASPRRAATSPPTPTAHSVRRAHTAAHPHTRCRWPAGSPGGRGTGRSQPCSCTRLPGSCPGSLHTHPHLQGHKGARRPMAAPPRTGTDGELSGGPVPCRGSLDPDRHRPLVQQHSWPGSLWGAA